MRNYPSFISAFLPLIFLLGALMISTTTTLAQEAPTQKVTGIVLDEITLMPIQGARVTAKDSLQDILTNSDESGKFILENVPLGRRVITVTKLGYATYKIADILVQGGQEPVLEILMTENSAKLDSVVITNERSRQLSGLSTRSFTVEETRRYATTYFDPARVAASYPGVINTEDGTNNISIRGNSPNGLSWRLEGVDIVNPNHLPNAGTFSDRPGLTGGGVNILSAQMLKTSSFSSGAFDAKYGNVLSGVMDIGLRTGNNRSDKYTLQFGLQGLDFAVEGPIGDPGKASIVANYRYSTVGLLGILGVDFGDEEINFQDLSINLTIPTKIGTLTFFGIGGKSKNIFTGQPIDSLRTQQKERFDIGFTSRMGAMGMTHTALIGTKTLWRTVVAGSAIENVRTEDFIIDTATVDPVAIDRYSQSRFSLTTSITRKISPGTSLQVGGYMNTIGYGIETRSKAFDDPGPLQTFGEADSMTTLLQPYARLQMAIGKKLQIVLGAHAMFLELNGSSAIEPRFQARYQISAKQSVTLGYGLHSQMQPLNLYFSPVDTMDGQYSYINSQLGFTKAHHAVLSYARQVNEHLSVKVEPYFQYLFDVPIVQRAGNTFSALNLFEGFISDTLTNAGTGMNYGVEASAEQTLGKGYYYLVSGTYYESTYVGGDSVERPTRYNGQYAASVTGGKEFYFNKKGKSRVVSIDAHLVYRGGFYTTPIDTLGSIAAGRTLFKEDQAFSEKLPDYVRLDIRIAHKKSKKGYTRTIALDIQNALNQENIAYRYYDSLTGEIVTKNQLGLIPFLTYRLEF